MTIAIAIEDVRREAKILRALTKHNNLVQFYDAFEDHENVYTVMESTSEGKVQTIKQGYLSKRSSKLRSDWKRIFFVLDHQGKLYYYRKQWSRPSVVGNQFSIQRSLASEHGSGLLSRWLSSHYHDGVPDEKSVARHTVDLLTSTIKVGPPLKTSLHGLRPVGLD